MTVEPVSPEAIAALMVDGKLTFSLDEVAAMTGFAASVLQREAHAGHLAHVHRGNFCGMTLPQIWAVVEASTVEPTAPVRTAEQDEDEAISARVARKSRRAA